MTEAENREIPRPFPSEPDFDHSPLETGPDRPQYLPTAREWEERDTADVEWLCSICHGKRHRQSEV